MSHDQDLTGLAVAVVGMAGRFPGAPDLEAFWSNLREGVESVTFFSDNELLAQGVPPEVLADPSFVKAKPVLDDVDRFDAAFFHYTPREAEIMDPQQRLFLECCWSALEDAGRAPGMGKALVGVYAGTGMNGYLLQNLITNLPLLKSLGNLQAVVGNDKDYLATRVSYKLDLRGPSITVQTACSTSLVAVHLACQGLLNGECDLALAGGVSLNLPQRSGYFYQKEGILSPDGHCRTFDARGKGTIFGSGVGVVALRRLEDALGAGDRIRAVIRGSAVNNDGAAKVGFTAPRVEGQAEVIRTALLAAEVDPETVTYVEAHGTATPMGDPIELQALTEVFSPQTRKRGFCALGSVKTNVGHLDTAAGIAGLVKTVLALEHREIPPSLHFERPNPEIDLESGPFYVNARLAVWPAADGVGRRAGVSSFGIGGTNAHVVLEEAPPREPGSPSRPWQLLLLSARTEAALERATDDLAGYLRRSPGEDLADVAYTLQTGRRAFEHRRVLLCREREEAARALDERDPERVRSHFAGRERATAWLFPGQGAQHPGMAAGLYESEPTFRARIDACAERLRSRLGLDLRSLLYPPPERTGEAARQLDQTALAQPALFAVEVALAELWQEWGIRPAALLGHSVGEYAAAAVAGVFDIEEGLDLVAERGRLMQDLPPGAMLSVPLPAADLLPELPRALAVAAVNGPGLTVLSGPREPIEDLRFRLAARGVETRLLHTSHAFHSAMMEPVMDRFLEAMARVRLRPPRIPLLSNLTGTWLTGAQATESGSWVRQLRQTVRFGEGLEELFRQPDRILLEVGPGHSLSALAQRHPQWPHDLVALASLPHPLDPSASAAAYLYTALGHLWLAGVPPDWEGFYRHERRLRVGLPTYSFERQRFWIEPGRQTPGAGHDLASEAKPAEMEEALESPAAGPPVAGAHPRPVLGTAYVAPRTPTEGRIASIWQALLGLDRVGIHDGFLELGGHSLLATRIVAELGRVLHLDLPVRSLFETPTVARLAEAVERRLAERGEKPLSSSELPSITPDPARRNEPFPLTEVQQAYWIGRSGAFELGNVATHFYVELEGDGIDLERLSSGLRSLIDRHDMLRAVVLPDGRQRILAEVPPYRIQVLDVAGLPPKEAEAMLEQVRRAMSHQVLSSDRWPLFEVRASHLAGGSVRLHVSFDFLIGDAWSIHLLTREWARLYAEAGDELPPLELSFRDYVLAEEALRDTPLYRRALEYWRQRLPSLPPGPDLPLAKNPSAVAQPRFVRRAARLDPEAWGRLKERSSREGITPSILLLTAFSEVLATWSKAPRFLVNLTLFQRLPLHPQVHEVVGDFTSLTLVEVDASQPEPFLARSRRLQDRLLEDLEHRYVSGVRVLRELAQESGTRRAPAVPVVFTSTLGLPESGSSASGGPSLRQVYSISQTPQVWLDHQIAEVRGALGFTWDSVDELFPPGLLDDMFAAYRGLLDRLAAEPVAWEERLCLVPEAQILACRPQGPAAPVSQALLHQLFLAQAEAQPGQTAVITPRRTLAYGDLRRRATQLAVRLRERGARPNCLVAVAMEKGWEQVVAVLAVLEAGAAYLPVDPALPVQRFRYLLEHGEAALAITQPWLEPELDWPEGVIRLTVEEGPGPDLPPLPPVQEAGDLAYVIFTSGSTGLPKGVMIDHRGAVNTVLDVNRRFGVGPSDRVLALSSLSFDLSVYDLFGVLAAGGAMVIPAAGTGRTPAHWEELMRRERVTLWSSVPALLEMLVEHLSGAGRPLPDGLRLVMMSGDWIPLTLPDRIRELSGDAADVEIMSLGGATEASIWSILYPVGKVEPSWASIPYGRAMDNQAFHVLDEALEARPVWVAGQLYIGGVGLAQGYWRDPQKTAASFFVHPRTGERLYRTGDLGRWLPDGSIEFLGREDFQVKVQGHRIELGEIEVALLEHPAVRACAVAALGERHQRRLAGYVVFKTGQSATEEELRSVLEARVPRYMVPPVLVVLPELPLTANGKVDRGALPAPEKVERSSAPAPANERQRRMAEIWGEVLGIGHVGVHDNFFSLGGDSILSIQIVSRANRAGLPITPDQIFTHPTVSELDSVLSGGEEPRQVAAGEGPVVGPVPLTPIQHWMFEQELPDPHHWNQAVLLELRERLDLTALRRAAEALVVHHDALRLRFAASPTGWRQFNAPPEDGLPTLAQFDLAGLPEDRRVPAMERSAAALQASLDLAAGPLLRVAFFELGPSAGSRLLLILHHLVVDGVSWRILLEDLESGYRQAVCGAAIELPAKAGSFRAWAERLSEHAWSGGNEEELGYWLSPDHERVRPLPVDFPGGEARNTEGSVRTVAITLGDKETRTLLQRAPEILRAQMQEVLLTALAVAVSPWAGGPLLVELEVHGRESLFPDLDFSRAVGWFTSVYPLLLDAPPEQPVAALTAAKECLRRVPGKGVGYGVLRYLNPKPRIAERLRSLPRPQIGFNYLGQFDQVVSAASLLRAARESTGPWSSPRLPRRHLLFVYGSVSAGRLHMGIGYSENVHRRETIEALAKAFFQALRSLAVACEGPGAAAWVPSDFPLAQLGSEEVSALSSTRNGDRIEDLYRLSPTQEGILFHWLYSGDPSLYVTSFGCTLRGLDAPAFAAAWQAVVSRHPVLRTAFVWEGLSHPVQVVFERIEVAWERGDWRGLPASEREAHWDEALRKAPVNIREVSRAPLLRLSLFQVEEDAFRFLFTHHHLILDGWSLPLLLQEVFLYYAAHRQGREPQPARPRPFREYIAWLLDQDLGEAESFWRRSLRGFTSPTRLGIDRGAPGSPVRGVDHRDLRLSAAETSGLMAVARAHQITLNTLVQGVWALVLARHADRDEVCFGSVVAGRPPSIPDIESMLGVFLNTLPVRLAVPPFASAAAWLRELQAQQVEMRRHEHSPLAQVQQWSETPGGLPLFESILVFENYLSTRESVERAGSGLEVRNSQASIKTNYPLVLSATPGTELVLSLSFDAQRFDGTEAVRMLDFYRLLLAELCANPERSLESLPVLTDAERRQIAKWNETTTDYRTGWCLHELIEEQVERTPDFVAVTSEEGQLTYRELDRLANGLAGRLRRLGVGSEVRVGVCAERSLGLVVGLLAVLKAGGAYVPLDPAYPAGRLAAILEDSEIPVLLAQERLLAILPAHRAEVVFLDDPELANARLDTCGRKGAGVGPDSLAYTIFTSGSTGRPKGAMNPHRGIVNRLLWMQQAYGLTASDRVLQKTPFSFDVSVWELFWPLMAGARLVLARPEGHKDTAYLCATIAREGVTTLHFVPSMLEAFLAFDELQHCAGLRRVFCSGEALSAPLAKRFFERLGGVELYNLYGPTEAAVEVTIHACSPAEDQVPIGRPVANTSIHLLARDGRPVPVGAPGELYIGGVQVGRGYLGRPDLTAERFVPDPFREPGSRLYRTGDLARYLPSGEIEYLGRIDHQVKIRGFRIELGEIEAALARHPSVRRGVVVAWEEAGSHKRLVAYLIAHSDEVPPTPAELRSWLRESLPDFMVPAAFVFLDALPSTPSGKVDRLALPTPNWLAGNGQGSYVAPRAPVEETLAAIWADILGVERVGIQNSFFELGGDSILSLQMVARAQQAGLLLTPQQIFERRTIAELAAVVQEGRAARREQGPVIGPVPLTPVQRRFFEERRIDPHHFNQALLLELREAVSPGLLAASVAYLLVHHDALRLRFEWSGGEWRQTSAEPGGDVPFTMVDLSALPNFARGEAQQRAAAAAQASLRLAEGPLLRGLQFRRDGETDRLLLAIHHLVVDGVSWRILLEDLEAGCRQLARTGRFSLPPKTTSFREWGELLDRHACSEEIRAELDYWDGVVRAPATCLPVDLLGTANTVGSSRTVFVALEPDETEALLREVPKTYRTEVNDVLLTALALAFRQWTGEPALRIDLEGHGREAVFEGVDLSRTVGWFTAIFPVRLSLPTEGGPRDALKSIKEQLRRVPCRGLGYGLLRYLGGLAAAERLQAAAPEVLFNYLGQMDRELPDASLFGRVAEPAGSPYSLRQNRSHLLEVNSGVSGGRLWLSLAYSENLHRRQTLEALGSGFLNELRGLIRHCRSVDAGGFTPSDFPMMSFTQDELDDVIDDLSGGLE